MSQQSRSTRKQHPSLAEKSFGAIDRNDFKPLYIQLAEKFIDYILVNKLQPGDPFPSQNELCRIFGVSVMPVRHALQRVTSAGYLSSIQGKGTFVAFNKIAISPKQGISIEEQLTAIEHVTARVVSANLALPIERRRQDLQLAPGEKTFRLQRILSIHNTPLCLSIWHMPARFKRLFQDDMETLTLSELQRRLGTEIREIIYHIRSLSLLDMDAHLLNVAPGTHVLALWFTVKGRDFPLVTGRSMLLTDKVELVFTLPNMDYSIKVDNH